MLKRVGRTAAFVFLALLATLAFQSIWSALLVTNLKSSPGLPWAPIVEGLIAWSVWTLMKRWQRASSAAKHNNYLATNKLSQARYVSALIAGFLALGTLVLAWLILSQSIPSMDTARINLNYPLPTVLLVLVTSSLVGAFSEEIGMRGFVLGKLQQLMPIQVAIILMALIVSPAHGLTQGFGLPLLLWYFVADCMFGTLVHLANSLRPAIIVHAVGLFVFFALIWPNNGYRDFVLAGSPIFLLEISLTVVLAVLTIMAFFRLSRLPTQRQQLAHL